MGYSIFRTFAFPICRVVAFLAVWLCALMDANNKMPKFVYAVVIGTVMTPKAIASLLLSKVSQ